jgi:L,D-transpeptidase YcbB
MLYQKFIIIICLMVAILKSSAQSDSIKFYLFDNQSFNKSILTKKLYQITDYPMIWNVETEAFRNNLTTIIANAAQYGLAKEKYRFVSKNNIFQNDILQTDLFLRFINDLAYGDTPLKFSYNGLNYQNDCLDLVGVFRYYLQENDVQGLLNEVQPKNQIYQQLMALNHQILDNVNTIKGFEKEAKIIKTQTFFENKPLIKKLQIMNLLPSVNDSTIISELTLTETIKCFERLFNLKIQGNLNENTLRYLNISTDVILKKIAQNLNQYRGLRCMEVQPHIRVNLPSTQLTYYENDSVLLRMRVIVGKKTTPTPTFCSKIYQVTFFPYWNVPQNIALNELIPMQVKDRHFMDNNGLQVLNPYGEIIDETTIDWTTINAQNFNYRLRQVAGCDNSLGILKFEINSPYSIYLHDTNNKKLFAQNNRFLSHGCIRLEKPYELGALLLNDRALVQKMMDMKNNDNLKPIPYKIKQPVPVFITNFTIAFNDANELTFYDEPYNNSLLIK